MNNTVEWWDVDGVSLHMYGWSVTTLGGNRIDLPSRRGSNITISGAPGQRWVPKQPDSHIITLSMFLTGMDPATGDQTGDEILRWNDSWDFLQRLFWRVEGRQFVLTRRRLLTINGVPTILVTSGLGEFSAGMVPTMTGRTRAEFTVDITMASPYFFGQQITVPLNVGIGTPVFNPGHDLAGPSGNMEVILTGPLTNPRITNATASPDVWVLHKGTIAAGVTVTLDVGSFNAVDSNGVNRTGKIVNSGAKHWMGLLPGANLLTLTNNDVILGVTAPVDASILTAVGDPGTAAVRFKPPYV